MDYNIKDNFLPKKELQLLQELVMGSDFPWYYQPRQVEYSEYGNVADDLIFFSHMCYMDDRIWTDYYSKIADPILKYLDYNALIRVKCNLYLKTNTPEFSGHHIDQDFPHKIAVFYVNSNNGYTLLDGKEKVESVENRLVMFDGLIPHQAVTQTDDKVRINININYL